MSRWRRRLLQAGQLVAIAVLAVVLLTVLGPEAPSTSYRATGDPVALPPQQLTGVDAQDFGGMLMGLRGEPVIVNVWASWCAPCRAEMPLLQRASEEYRGEVTFLGVASKDSHTAASSFLQEIGVTYPNVFDSQGEVRRELDLRGFPTTYVFDASGELREAVVGGITEQRLAAILEDVTA